MVEPTPSGSLTDTLATIATDSARMAAVPARRGNRAPIRAQSAAQIALATRQARAAGQRLAGYDGRIVDPGQGLGTVIAFGSAIVEYDPVSDRDRQALIRWADVESARTVLGLPAGAFGRAPGLPGILGDATGILNHGGYVARHVRTGGQYATAWKIGHFDSRLDSESLGKREALITLSHAGEIACNAPDHPGAAAVLADFDRRVAETLIPSDDLQRRVIACLESHFGARDTDLGLYVSPYHASKALDLIVAIRPIAGRKIRAWSHTDRESIADALCDSFAADLGRLESDVAKKADDLRKLAGASLIERCERLRAECEGLAAILGSDATASYRARIQACDAAITSALDATSQRFAMLDLS